tara:strand:+ start:358 stop:1032 length:675 start_codon:yes stop_codon:yes gene_type:complete
MEESRKEALIEKLAAKKGMSFDQIMGAAPTEPKKSWGSRVLKEALEPKSIGVDLRKALGKGAILGGSALLASKYLKPKKTLIQKMIGEGTPGRKALMFGAGAAGIGAGLKGVESLGEAITKPLMKKKYFNEMMDENPTLKKENPRDVSRIFRTLYTFNPKMASDPLVAGSFMRRSLQFKDEGIQPVDVKTLAEVGKFMRDAKKKDSLLSNAFAATGSELMGFGG